MCSSLQELFLVPNHKITDIHGASFAGFYYICLEKSKGSIEGYYYHKMSEWYMMYVCTHIGIPLPTTLLSSSTHATVGFKASICSTCLKKLSLCFSFTNTLSFTHKHLSLLSLLYSHLYLTLVLVTLFLTVFLRFDFYFCVVFFVSLVYLV